MAEKKKTKLNKEERLIAIKAIAKALKGYNFLYQEQIDVIRDICYTIDPGRSFKILCREEELGGIESIIKYCKKLKIHILYVDRENNSVLVLMNGREFQSWLFKH